MENKKVIGTLKVLFLVFYLSTTAMLLWQYLEILTITDVTSKGLSVAVYLIFFVLILGGIGNVMSIAISISGLFLSKKRQLPKSNIRFFVLGIILPIITETIFILLCILQ